MSLILEGNHSIRSAAKQSQVSKSMVMRWYTMYEIHGVKGLSMKSGSYSGAFKLHVVEYMHTNNISMREASAKFGIPSRSTLLKWERIYYEEGANGLMRSKRGRPPKNNNHKPTIKKNIEEDLIAEIQQLRAENAYLKKYNALVQEKQNLTDSKKQK